MANTKLDALTGIRALAALWVAGFHFSTFTFYMFQSNHLQPTWLSLLWLKPFLQKGYLGVDLFFILSGFVLSLVHQQDFKPAIQKSTLFQFLGLRLARIYPVMLSTLLLIGLVWLFLHHYGHNGVGHTETYTLSGFLTSLFMVQSWGIGKSDVWNIPAWSVSAEWFVYLLFPFIAFGLVKVKQVALYISIALISLLSLHLFAFYFFHSSLQSAPLDLSQGGLPSLFRVTSEFMIGACIYNIFLKWKINSKVSDALGIMLCCLIPLTFYMKQGYIETLIVMMFAVLIFCLSMPGKLLKIIFANRLMVHLGEISYSFYMIHQLIVYIGGCHILEKIATTTKNGWLFFSMEIVLLLITLLAAKALYQWVEIPGRRWIRDRILSQPVAVIPNSNPTPNPIRNSMVNLEPLPFNPDMGG